MKIKNVFPYIAVIMISMIIISCSKDNGVQPKPPEDPIIVDSNVFEWKYDTIWTSRIGYIYAVDTNDIFISGYPYAIRIKSGVKSRINYNDNDFTCSCLKGIDENNVYFGGLPYYCNISYKSKLKKWNGTAVEDIPMPDDSSHGIHDLLPVADNDLWAICRSNLVYHVTGSDVKTYKLMGGFSGNHLFQDNNENIYASMYEDYGGLGEKYIKIIYKYDRISDRWNMVEVDSAGYYFGIHEVCILDKKLIGKSPTEFCYFTEQGWVPIKSLGPQYHPVGGAGNNINDMIFLAIDETLNSAHVIYYFDGNKYYRQSYEYAYTWGVRDFGNKYNKFYYTTLAEDISVLHTLTLKNNFSKNLNQKK